MAVSIEELQEAAFKVQRLQRLMEAVEEQVQELSTAKAALAQITETTSGDEVLAPLTNGIYVKTTLCQTDKVLINIGTGVAVEKTPEEAITLLANQEEELAEIQQSLVAQFSAAYEEYLKLQVSQNNG